MSDERETTAVPDPGAPIEEGAAGENAVRDAVDRAATINDDGAHEVATEDSGTVPAAYDDAATSGAAATPASASPTPLDTSAATATATPSGASGREVSAEEQAHRARAAQVDTHLNLEQPTTPQDRVIVAEPIETPSAAAEPTVGVADTPARDGEIRISADHPMAALYMQSPMPPDLKGNRGAGFFISLLATLAFALIYAAIIAVWIAPTYPPSTFLTEGLLPWIMSWGFIAGVVAFLIGLVILVMIFGRAGWWAYVIFSLFVGVLVWFATAATFAITGTPDASAAEYADTLMLTGGRIDQAIAIMKSLAFTAPTLGAAIAAREVAIWFGAWIGRRGRKVTAKNAELLKEYEAALAEVRAKQ